MAYDYDKKEMYGGYGKKGHDSMYKEHYRMDTYYAKSVKAQNEYSPFLKHEGPKKTGANKQAGPMPNYSYKKSYGKKGKY